MDVHSTGLRVSAGQRRQGARIEGREEGEVNTHRVNEGVGVGGGELCRSHNTFDFSVWRFCPSGRQPDGQNQQKNMWSAGRNADWLYIHRLDWCNMSRRHASQNKLTVYLKPLWSPNSSESSRSYRWGSFVWGRAAWGCWGVLSESGLRVPLITNKAKT